MGAGGDAVMQGKAPATYCGTRNAASERTRARSCTSSTAGSSPAATQKRVVVLTASRCSHHWGAASLLKTTVLSQYCQASVTGCTPSSNKCVPIYAALVITSSMRLPALDQASKPEQNALAVDKAACIARSGIE